ncbi:MAG: restriction endonuclease [Pseudomonadota bacterium]
MPRRHSIFDDLITLPWWFNLLLAAAAYVLLKVWVPTVEFHSPVFRGVALAVPIFATVLTAMLVLISAVSAIRAWSKGELLNKQTGIRSVKELPWKDFEYLVGEAYRCKGFHVEENTGIGPDGGIDLTLTKDGEKHLVQCKNWKTKSVGVPIVRELYGVVTAENASGGIIVCSGSFTRDAIAFSRGKPIELVEGTELVRLIGEVQTQQKVETVSTEPVLSAQPSCPTCSSPMVMRTARKTGSHFWGCSRFPKCRGTRNVTG